MSVIKESTLKFSFLPVAIDHILSIKSAHGYGFLITHDEITRLIGLTRPVGKCDYTEFQTFELDRLGRIDTLTKELLINHKLCLSNVSGQGYRVLHPDTQVSKEPARFEKLAFKQLVKADRVLNNVQEEALSAEGRNSRHYNQSRVQFLKSCFKSNN